MLPRKIDQILSRVDRLWPMPTSVTRTLRAMEDPNITAGYVAELIALDQALAASVLQMANSVAMGFAVNCTSINEAVMRLGFKRLKNLVIGIVAEGPLSRNLSGYRIGAGDLWNHAISTAVTAQWLAQAVGYQDPDEAYLAGLLHDIGKLLLDQYIVLDYSKMIDLMQRYSLRLWQVEEQLLGIDHAAVGGLMAEKWNYPVVLIDAIRCHHAPSFARTKPELPAIVNVANALSAQVGVANKELFVNEIHPESYNILGLSENTLDQLRKRVGEYLSATHSASRL